MSEQPPAPPVQGPADAPTTPQPAPASAPPVQAAAHDRSPLQARAAAIAEERPEVAAGAALAAGFVSAMILRRLAR